MGAFVQNIFIVIGNPYKATIQKERIILIPGKHANAAKGTLKSTRKSILDVMKVYIRFFHWGNCGLP